MVDCLFCKIVKGEIPAKFEYQGERVIVFPDIHPKAPVHLLIVPKKHIREFAVLGEEEKEIWNEMIKTVQSLIEKNDLRVRGYRLVINGGPAALISHLHLHLLGGIAADRGV